MNGRAATIAATIALAGCAAPRAETTFLDSADLVDMTDTLAASLARAPAITARQADDAPWIVSVDRIANRTDQVIPHREKWLYVERLRAILARSDLGRERAIVWIIPPERWPIMAEERPDGPAGARLDPNHVLTAEFHALTRTSGRGRSDFYVCAYQLVDLATGSVTWEDAWEVKRATSGVTYD